MGAEMIAAIIAFFVNSDIAQAIGGLLTLFLAWKGNSAIQRRRGRVAERKQAQQEDSEHAQSIRDTVTRNRADGLRKHDDAGYRD
jgi:hypothetical protein